MAKKLFWFVIIIVVIGGGIFAVMKMSSPQQLAVKSEPSVGTTGPIKIGVVYGFTGKSAVAADMGKKGIDLAIKEVNASGGIFGRKLEAIYEDSQTDPTTSASAFNKLVLDDKVGIILAGIRPSTTNPLIPLADEQKIILISSTVMDASIGSSSPYFFTTGHTIESQKAAVEKFFDINNKVKTLSILCWNSPRGNASKDLILEVAKDRNIKVLSTDCTNDENATYDKEMAKIKSVNPDAIYFSSSSMDKVLAKIKQSGLGSKKILVLSPTVDAIEVTNTSTSDMKNVYFGKWVPDKNFVMKFKKEYGVEPTEDAQNHYDTIGAITEALQMKGDLITALHKVKFTGTEGYEIDFTKGDPLRVNGGQANLYTYDGEYEKVN